MNAINENENRILNAVLGGVVSDAVLKQMKKEIPQSTKVKGEAVVKLNFELSKGVDGEAVNTAAILSQAVVAKALVMSGIQVENFLRNLKKAAIEALSSGGKVAEALTEADQRVVAMIEQVKEEVVNEIPKQTKTGTVRVKAVPEFQSYKIEAVK